ncbi:MAG: PfaD family polyunsaturated fatty acid/polyketide biosynthesis protein [Candidatus Riflebacteria bacterium]|nr:PfaD family polyunsaturated fatty acid/polyketide biosynthesis protein [Candidatus Riflebacteria bacterium]
MGASGDGFPLIAFAPAIPPESLGSSGFCKDYGLRYAYIGGSMAHGISSPELAEALGRNGMLSFIGAAGRSLETVEAAINRMQEISPAIPYGFNLIHSPNEPMLEDALARLYIRRGVRLIEASAFLGMTLPLVLFRVHGIHRGSDGGIVTPNRVMAKASRVEVASKFFAPPPEKMLKELVSKGEITEEQARLASQIPVAQDMTAEADSGGHTDNRPAVSLLPTFLALRDRLQAQYRYSVPLRVGLGGGIATPASAAAAFAMGADWIVIGSVNQSCVESGVSSAAREMLAQAGQADTAMAPAGDMFEMGVNVQVLKRGTMFPMRASKLYELYRTHAGLHELPPAERANLEKNVFKETLDNIWSQTRDFFARRDPQQVERAERDPKHLMALVFRWYLGQSPRWAVSGEPTRKVDYQIWCGPAMGAFNEWVKGTFLEAPGARTAMTVALNLLFGASVVLRHQTLRVQGAVLPAEVLATPPLTPEAIFAAIR